MLALVGDCEEDELAVDEEESVCWVESEFVVDAECERRVVMVDDPEKDAETDLGVALPSLEPEWLCEAETLGVEVAE